MLLSSGQTWQSPFFFEGQKWIDSHYIPILFDTSHISLGAGAPARPPNGASPHQQQQQHPYTGGRPVGPLGARPPAGVRPPMSQQIRTDAPLQAGMVTAASHHPNPGHVQTPTPITTPATQPLSPPRPQMPGFSHNAGPPPGQQQQPFQQQQHPPYSQQQQQQQQQPTPPLANQQGGGGLNGLNAQMSAMSVGANDTVDASGYNQMPPQGPPMQSEVRVF